MITLEPYVFDNVIYPNFPDEHRWVFNKLRLSEKMGYDCGPSGTNTNVGRYIIRPIMNLAGMGTGGIFAHTTPVGPGGGPVNDHIPAVGFPGHFWCEQFVGPHVFCEYVNDVAVRGTESVTGGVSDILIFTQITVLPALPVLLQGVSRYAVAEFIDGNLIEYSPRHISTCASQESIDDYRTIDPLYNPTHVKFGFTNMRKVPFGMDGYTWEEIEVSRQPWA